MADRAVGIPFVKEGIAVRRRSRWRCIALQVSLGWIIPAMEWRVASRSLLPGSFGILAGVVPRGADARGVPGDGKVIAIEEEFEPRSLERTKYQADHLFECVRCAC